MGSALALARKALRCARLLGATAVVGLLAAAGWPAFAQDFSLSQEVPADSQMVLEALNAIRADAAIPCTLPVPEPDSGVIDYNSVNIGICDSAENSLTTFYVESADDCGNDAGGWYYTDGGSTRNIQLCEATCGVVSSAGAKLHFTLGCETITPEDVE